MLGAPAGPIVVIFLRVGWHPRHNHAYQILSRSRRGYGATGSKIGVFLFIFKPLLQQCFALPCYTVMGRSPRGSSDGSSVTYHINYKNLSVYQTL